MANDAIEVEGIVKDILGGGKYLVYIDDMDMEVQAYAAGKMKKFRIKIIPGDLVTVELNPYEPTQGRITYRSINRGVKKKVTGPAIVSLDDIVDNGTSSENNNNKEEKRDAT